MIIAPLIVLQPLPVVHHEHAVVGEPPDDRFPGGLAAAVVAHSRQDRQRVSQTGGPDLGELLGACGHHRLRGIDRTRRHGRRGDLEFRQLQHRRLEGDVEVHVRVAHRHVPHLRPVADEAESHRVGPGRHLRDGVASVLPRRAGSACFKGHSSQAAHGGGKLEKKVCPRFLDQHPNMGRGGG